MSSSPTSSKLSFDSDASGSGDRGRRSRPVQVDNKNPADVDRRHSRSKSIQFRLNASNAELPHRTSSWRLHRRTNTDTLDKEKERERKAARTPSPPPPNTYERGVSFDTFDNRDATDFSLTLNYKHKGYQSSRRSRTFLVGIDNHEYSDIALEWLMDELVEDGDEIVCLRVVEKDSRIASDAAIEAGKYRQEASKLFEQVIQKNRQDEKAISLALELAVGKVQDIIQRMIRIYEPAVLIVGSRGRNLNGMHGLFPNSVSKYCLQHSPIPVTVVGPSLKREKKKKKRLADPTRRSYNRIMEMSERRGNRLDVSSSTDSSVSRLPDEEAAVAEALGLPPSYANSRSSLSAETPSNRSSISHDEHEPTSSTIWNSLDADLKKAHSENSETTENEDVEGSENGTEGVDGANGELTKQATSSTNLLDSLSPVRTNDSMTSSNSSTLRPDTSDGPEERSTESNEDSVQSSPTDEDLRKPQVNIPVIITEDTSNDETKPKEK